MKKILLFILILVSFLFILKTAEAVPSIDMYTAENRGGPRNDEIPIETTPWLFLQLPYSGTNFTAYWWYLSDSKYFSFKLPSGSDSNWYSFSDFTYYGINGQIYDWDDIKKTGNWEITATGPGGSANTSVTLTPEPISSILFLLGGGTLALRQYKKRKKISK